MYLLSFTLAWWRRGSLVDPRRAKPPPSLPPIPFQSSSARPDKGIVLQSVRARLLTFPLRAPCWRKRFGTANNPLEGHYSKPACCRRRRRRRRSDITYPIWEPSSFPRTRRSFHPDKDGRTDGRRADERMAATAKVHPLTVVTCGVNYYSTSEVCTSSATLGLG